MPHLVRMIVNEDGDTTDDPVWHLAWAYGGSPAVFCTGAVYGRGEGVAQCDAKTTKRGGITCKRCMDELLSVKAVKL